MLVEGNMKVEVDVNISAMDALKIIEDYLGITDKCKEHCSLIVLPEENQNNKTGKRALFQFIDMCWYGSDCNEYKFVTSDEKIIQIYENLCYIKSLISKNIKLFE